MSKHYGNIAFTENVRDAQSRYGSRGIHARLGPSTGASLEWDSLTDREVRFIAERDGFYLATISDTGWPYVQFRGGPAGFLRVIDEHTIGWADFRGNRQYVSTGNLGGDDRVSLIVMDYADRQRLKIFGHARVTSVADEPGVAAALADVKYDAVVERAVVVSVDAFDWNCPQHITPRFTVAEIEPGIAALRDQVSALEVENAGLRRRLNVR